MAAEDEIRINEFLTQEAEPIFAHLQKNEKQSCELVDEYFNIVHETARVRPGYLSAT